MVILGLVVGCGVGVSIANVLLELDYRYTHGLVLIDETRFSFDPNNRVWSITLAILFQVGQ
jgi:hypothetical protein